MRLGVVAIELMNSVNDRTTQIYTLHNTGSEINMLRSPIAHKLGLTGVTKWIVISGINACKAVEALKTSIKS